MVLDILRGCVIYRRFHYYVSHTLSYCSREPRSASMYSGCQCQASDIPCHVAQGCQTVWLASDSGLKQHILTITAEFYAVGCPTTTSALCSCSISMRSSSSHTCNDSSDCLFAMSSLVKITVQKRHRTYLPAK